MNVGRNIAHGVKMIITTLVLCLLSETNILHAQELEYKYELGAMLGTGFYLGDANYSSLYKNRYAYRRPPPRPEASPGDRPLSLRDRNSS